MITLMTIIVAGIVGATAARMRVPSMVSTGAAVAYTMHIQWWPL